MKAFTKYLLLAVALAVLIMPAQAYWHDEDLAAVLQQAHSVQDAVNIVEDTLQQRGYEIPLIVDHSAAAASVGLELRPTQVVFARLPKHYERALLKRSNTVGIDLPIKILVFEDGDGAIQIRINPIGYMLDRHDIVIRDSLFRRLNRETSQFVDREDGLITVTSTRSLENTSLALQGAIGTAGTFRIPLVLDYGVGVHRSKPILIVFGNPMAGTPLMQNTQEVGLDLPQKFLIWEDGQGDVQITYNDPFFIAKRHNVQGQELLLSNISNALANFAAAGVGE